MGEPRHRQITRDLLSEIAGASTGRAGVSGGPQLCANTGLASHGRPGARELQGRG
jgi:hypothetical protein